MRTALLLLLAACATDPTYSGEVRAIVDAHCVSCHVPGGAAPFPMTTYEEVRTVGRLAVTSMAAGRMPPWSADPDCRDVVDARVLDPGALATFQAWVDADMPEGDPTDPLTWSPPPFDADLTFEPASGFVPTFEVGDAYRCIPLGTVEDDLYLSATQVLPASPLVHHVLVYALTPEQTVAMQARDAADPDVGYSCFGGPIATESGGSEGGLPRQIGAWVPGAPPQVFPDGVGQRVEAGATLIMQVHYSAVAGEPVEDRTRVALAVYDEAPDLLVEARPLPVMDLFVPAGATEATATATFTNWRRTPMTVRTAAGHMHLLGREISATVTHADATESCLMDLPAFDFDWQQAYVFDEPDWVTVQPGESITVTCSYDNADDDQPVVDGERLAPRDVHWGDGTLDEMCLVYLGLVEAYTPVPDADAAPCEGMAACAAACDDDDFACLLACEATESCTSCLLESMAGCAFGSCLPQTLAAETCLRSCGLQVTVLGGVLGDCLAATCPDASADLLGCADGPLAAGTCDAPLASCGL